MIKPTDNISNANEYEQNQGNFIDQNANFRLDDYHKQPDSFNNYQIPPPKFQDIDQFVSNNINKSQYQKDPQYSENISLRPNEINDAGQDEPIPQIDDGKQLDLLYEKNRKRENNSINAKRSYRESSKDEVKNYSKNGEFISKFPNYPQLEENNMNDHQPYAYQQPLDANDQQEYDHTHQLHYGEPNGDQIYYHRQIQPDLQVEYRTQHPPPIQYETQPQQPYLNDSYADIYLKNTIPSPGPQPQQQQYYNQPYRRYSNVQHPPSPSQFPMNPNQYHAYQQDDYIPIEMKHDHFNRPYQSQHPSQYNQSPSYLPSPPYSRYSQYQPPPPSQQSIMPPRQMYSQNQNYAPPPLQQREGYPQPLSSQQQYHEQEFPSSSKLVYNHQSNIMLVDIPPSGRFARQKQNKLQQRFNCKIMSAEIANFSPDASFQYDPLNMPSSRSSSGPMPDYMRQPPIPQAIQQPPLPQQDPPILVPKPSLTNQIQPQPQYTYYDHDYPPQDSYGYHQPYPQELNQPYPQESRRLSSTSQLYQQPPYPPNYPPQEYPLKNSNLYYSQYPTHSYPYPADQQPMQTMNNIPLNENLTHRSPISDSYSDYDDVQPKINEIPQYAHSTDDEDIAERMSDSGNNEGYDGSDNENKVNKNTKNSNKNSKSDKKTPNKKKKSNNPKPKKTKANNATNGNNQGSTKSKKNNSNVDNEDENNKDENENLEKASNENEPANEENKNEDENGLEILQTKKKNKFKPQRLKVIMKTPQENPEASNQDQEPATEETQEINVIKKGRGTFLRPIGFDEALEDETLILNPYTIGFQPQSYWEIVNRDVTFGQLVNTYFASNKKKIKPAKFVFKLYNMLLLSTHDDRYKELVGFNWFSDFVISIDRLAASAMLNLSTTNCDVVLPALLDECGFEEVTNENFGLAHLSSFPAEESKKLKFYYHKSSLFSKREMSAAELERLETKKTGKRGKKNLKYPAQS